jgi:polyphenol oxidase
MSGRGVGSAKGARRLGVPQYLQVSPEADMPMTTANRRVFSLIARGGVEWLECTVLSGVPWVRHAFSTRVLHRNSRKPRAEGRRLPAQGLSTFNGRPRDSVEGTGISPYALFFDRLGVGTLALAGLRQIHSSVVHYAWTQGPGTVRYTPSGCTRAQAVIDQPPCGDALVSDQPGILLSVCTADCVPLLLVDPARRAIAAVHAGWRGSLERIAEKTVGEMQRTFHSQPEELLAAIGPCIRDCCYQVGQEVVEAFCGRFIRCESYFKERPLSGAAQALRSHHPLSFLSATPPGHAPDGGTAAHLDLVAVTRDQLRNAGLSSTNIHVASYCTACRTDLFFSYRKEGTTGRMMAVIGMI